MVLVTGGTGMLGAHLLYRLIGDGHKVKATYRNVDTIQHAKKIFALYCDNPQQIVEKISWLRVELNDFDDVVAAMQSVERVYHLAAQISFAPAHAKQMIRTNRSITANIVNAALHCKIGGFCHASSIAALGQQDSNLIDEKTDRDPQLSTSAYSISKYQSEMEVWRAMAEGLPATIVNPSIIIGPGDWRSSSPAIFRRVANGLKYYTEGTASYVSVHDVVNSMVMLMENEAFGQRYIISAENISYKQFFGLVAKAVGKPAADRSIKKWQLKIVNAIVGLGSAIFRYTPPITSDMLRSAYNTKQYDNRKFVETYNYKYQSISEAVAQTAKQYLQAHQ